MVLHRLPGVCIFEAPSPLWLESSKCRVGIGGGIVTFSSIQTFRMQECAKTYDKTLQMLEDSRKMQRMVTELLVLAVRLHGVPLGWRHHRPSATQKKTVS